MERRTKTEKDMEKPEQPRNQEINDQEKKPKKARGEQIQPTDDINAQRNKMNLIEMNPPNGTKTKIKKLKLK